MTYAKCIVLAFTTLGKTADTAVLSVRNKNIAPAGQYVMTIGLVTSVPHQLIIRSIIDIMECRGELHHAEACPKMTAMNAYNINDVLPQLIAYMVDLCTGTR